MVAKELQCWDLEYCRKENGLAQPVLKGISARFEPGRIALISGANGSGKSTFLHVLGGLLRPSKGEVIADGEPVSRYINPHRDLWRRTVGFVFQSPHLLEDLTAIENVILPTIPRKIGISEAKQKGIGLLENLGISHMAGKSAFSASGGERQRIALARALVSDPNYLLVDEPSSHQDDRSLKLVCNCLQQARNRGAVVVVTTHDARLADALLPDTRQHLVNGCLFSRGMPEAKGFDRILLARAADTRPSRS